ncbi:MAG: hypothetical protein WCW16_02405 [Candidatus Magasanikbacteria bacterium]
MIKEQEVYNIFYKKIIRDGYFGNQIGGAGIDLYEADLLDGLDTSVFMIPTFEETYGEGGQGADLISQYFKDCVPDETATLNSLLKKYPSLHKLIMYSDWQRKRFEALLKKCKTEQDIHEIRVLFREIQKHDTFQPERDEMHREHLEDESLKEAERDGKFLRNF